MKKRKYLHRALIPLICLTAVLVGTVLIWKQEDKIAPEKVKASSVVTQGDFRLTAENRWDNKASAEGGKNYAELNWDEILNLGQSDYQLNQSEDGKNWISTSLGFGKPIKVLNIYPNSEQSNTLKKWMDGLGLKDKNGGNLIDVTSIKINDYNSNANSYLKDDKGMYIYDVLMFGSFDLNGYVTLSTESAYKSTREFSNTGRGILFGHDTIAENSTIQPNFFLKYREDLGIGVPPKVTTSPSGWKVPSQYWNTSTRVELLNDGYLMKYPFEMENGVVLSIPSAHNIEMSEKKVGTTWMEFLNGTNPIYDDGEWRGNWYLKTNNNLAMIQTGHSNGASTVDEQKIIANTLYNLAQVSSDNSGNDYTVMDNQAPKKPEISIRCGVGGENEKLNIKVDAEDLGKEYFWNVDAILNDGNVKKSDTVSEKIISNIAGYFYEVSDSPTSSLKTTVEGYKDSYGRIPKDKYSVYVAPDSNETEYETQTGIPIDEKRQAGRYIHVLAVDRANNVSEVTSQELNKITQLVDYEIERTKDEAKLVDFKIDSSLEKTTKSLEIQIPKNTKIKDFKALTLPATWFSYENSQGADYLSFSFATPENNGNADLIEFLEKLRFSISSPTDQSGTIRVILKEMVLTSRLDEEGTMHYYSFTPKILNWNDAYNEAKSQSYRGLVGYLATITNEEEHDFIFDNIAKAPGWLGGTRAKLKDKTMTNDRMVLPTDTKEFLIDFTNGSQWYWANGPEAGEIYFTKPTRAEGGVAPPGVYDGWYISNKEPNNNASKNPQEAFLQFAYNKSKLWNDIALTNKGALYNKGFYTEFSRYGDQVEGEDWSDSCWIAPIPQKISIKGELDTGGSLTSGDLLYDQELRIGKEVKLTPNIIPEHEFIKSIHEDGSSNSLTYLVKSTVQNTDKNIYGKRKVILHLRQIIENSSPELVIPKEGYGSLLNLNSKDVLAQEWSVTAPSSKDNAIEFDSLTVLYQGDENHFMGYQETIPMGYQLIGYVVTSTKTPHQVSMASPAPIKVDVSNTKEFWLTIYLKPSSSNQSPYSWDYQKNDLGVISN